MFVIEPVIESVVDLNALAHCVDMTTADQRCSKPIDKLSILASSIFGLDISDQWIHLTFFVRLPSETLDLMNAFVRCNGYSHNGISEGFVSGTLAQFTNFVIACTVEKAPTRVRLVANQFYTHLREKYGIMKDREIKMLPDKTFLLK